uniref:hypothetical protein n=1 Tax=Hericium alpestre TaxID=135208 RepID=UPI002435C0AA|nr:hypothetical protein QEO35_mgp01 [Hericium alpestre]WEX32031.1 hypothetical protein [Hericium alpestre]
MLKLNQDYLLYIIIIISTAILLGYIYNKYNSIDENKNIYNKEDNIISENKNDYIKRNILNILSLVFLLFLFYSLTFVITIHEFYWYIFVFVITCLLYSFVFNNFIFSENIFIRILQKFKVLVLQQVVLYLQLLKQPLVCL